MEILGTKPLHQTRFLSLYEREYRHNEKVGKYFLASRGNGNSENKAPDAVIIVGFIDDKLVLTSEYRVAIASRELSFPAGLIDQKDRDYASSLESEPYLAMQLSAEHAAIREFKEETGLKFVPIETSPPNLHSSAGLTDESVCVVHGIATGTPSKEFLEGSEDIETLLLTHEELVDFMAQNRTIPYGKHAWGMLWAFREFGFPKWGSSGL